MSQGNQEEEPNKSSTDLIQASQNLPAIPTYGQLAGYGGSLPQDDAGIDFRHYFQLIMAYKWLILGVTAVFTILGVLWTLMQTPLYTATVRLQIDTQGTKVVEEGDISSNISNTRSYMQTQYQLIKSRAMSERIVASLNIYKPEAFIQQRSRSMSGYVKKFILGKNTKAKSSENLEKKFASLIRKNISVQPVRGSSLVDISYTDLSPVMAKKIANAYADAIISSTIDKRFQANAYAKTFLEDQLGQLKIKLKETQRVMLDFAEKEKIVEMNKGASVSKNNLASANTALGNLISERIKKEQSWKQVQNAKGTNLSQFLKNSVIDTLRGKQKELSTEYKEKLQLFKPGYPEMVEIQNKIKEINRQIANEVRTIKSSLKSDYQSSLAEEEKMKARIENLRAKVLDYQKRSVQYNILKGEVKTNRNIYNSLLDRYKKVDIAAGVSSNSIFIIDKAALPSVPSSPNLKRSLLLSLVLGLLLGGGLAIGIDHLDDTIKSGDDLKEITGLTTLGMIPSVPAPGNFEDDFNDSLSSVSEAYRTLATSLQLSTEHGLPRTLTLTSSEAGEGKSSTAIAITRHFASLGLRVLLIDADLRKASLHTKLGLPNEIGLSNCLTDSATLPKAVQPTNIPGLTFMSSGPLPPNAADLLGGKRIHALITESLEQYDFILFDGPPVLGLADAQLLSNATSATIFVVNAGRATKSRIVGALQRLWMAKVNVIGTVLTKLETKHYGYGYGYGADELKYGHDQIRDKENQV